jgi:hypothetical protein
MLTSVEGRGAEFGEEMGAIDFRSNDVWSNDGASSISFLKGNKMDTG